MDIPALQRHLTSSPFARSVGLQLDRLELESGLLAMRLPWRSDFEDGDGRGTWHGGPIGALIDTAGAFAASAAAGRDCGTVDLQVSYLRPARGTLVATAHVRKGGRTLSIVDVDVHDETGKLCAIGRGTFFVSAGG